MSRTRIGIALAGFLVTLVALSRGLGAEKASPALAGFLQAIDASAQLSQVQKQSAANIAAELQAQQAGDAEVVHACLLDVHPEFRRAMILLGEEDSAAAKVLLARLAESDDAYLAAESAYFHARAFVITEEYEQALSMLTSLAEAHGEHSFRRLETEFFTGFCQAQLLKRSEAIASLRRFLREYPSAPERIKIAAHEKLSQLGGIDNGTLADVQNRMEYVRRRLAIRESGSHTQEEQEHIVALLDRLIDPPDGHGPQAPTPPGPPDNPGPPDDHPPHPGPSKPGPRGGPNGDDGDGGNGATDGDPHHPRRRATAAPRREGDGWDHVRDNDREVKALAALRAKFPQRYAELVKQYYRSCMEE